MRSASPAAILERLEVAAAAAAAAGLEVWFSPFTCDLTAEEMLDLLADCAERAERLRQQGAEVVFVTGAELSLLNKGFLPGDTIGDRMATAGATPHRLRELIAAVPARINDFLGKAVAVVRERFGGKITYAAMPFEGVDWTPFDFIAVDLYRSIEIADRYRAGHARARRAGQARRDHRVRVRHLPRRGRQGRPWRGDRRVGPRYRHPAPARRRLHPR